MMIAYQFRRAVEAIIRNLFTWNDWTPTVTQSTESITVTVNYAKYMRIGNLVHVVAILSVTSAGIGNNAIVIGGLPVAPATNVSILGVARVFDTGTAEYVGVVNYVAGNLYIMAHNSGNGVYVGATPNFALANGDIIDLNLAYPVG